VIRLKRLELIWPFKACKTPYYIAIWAIKRESYFGVIILILINIREEKRFQ